MNDSDPNIDALLTRVLRGETSAFEGIVRRFERPLRAWFAAHAPPGVDVDEIAQRSFVAAFTRLPEYELGTNFAGWLFTIARFQLRTETTRLRRIADYHSRFGPDLLRRELDRRCDDPPDHCAIQFESLTECLEALAEQSRCFVAWRYDEEIPLDEMSRRSGRSVAAVKKQLWKIRQQLQKCVEARMEMLEGGAS
ncbi:sigma-70 family RNA polymerase sigma factor [Rubripirellula amarantea]|nr:sigma-70 family RNA polymerase sigma factor [Rubripirellula amarantea]